MLKNFYITLLLLAVTISISFAQSGRIAGRVADKKTGEPLPGANVIIEGTTLGAATDVNGDFIIHLVPPGTYTVKASYIGYRNVVVKNIRVVAGLTVTLNFALPSEEISAQEIVITAQRPLIHKSATNAIRVISSEDIDALPVRNVGDIMALQPGVVRLRGVTYIRGSRADETGYLLEGVNVKNILSTNGGSLISVIPDALNEISLQAGGYNAEYGNANAGIVSEDFKTGTNNYHFSYRLSVLYTQTLT